MLIQLRKILERLDELLVAHDYNGSMKKLHEALTIIREAEANEEAISVLPVPDLPSV